MFRFSRAAGCAVFVACAAITGCQKAVEVRSIEAFHAALKAEDLDKLKESTSPRFKDAALRSTAAVEEIKRLRLPQGEIRVIDTADVTEKEKKAVVEIGKSSRKYTYRLVRKDKESPWIVDDIYFKQRHRGLTSRKAVTEQMDLLLTLREFLGDWHSGRKQDVTARVTPQFKKLLAQMPPEMLKRMSTHIVGELPIEKRHDPQAMLAEGFATVQLDRRQGQLTLVFKRSQDRWWVDDLAFRSLKENDSIASFRKTALAMLTAEKFLTAYRTSDRRSLGDICTKEFFNSGLKVANPKLMPIPVAKFDPRNTQIKAYPKFAELVHTSGDQTVQIKLDEDFGDGTNPRRDLDAREIRDPNVPTKYRVSEVTLHNSRSKQQVRLSTYFLSHGIVQLFADAIEKGDLQTLKLYATPDFKNRVWDRLDPKKFRGLPFAGIQKGLDRIVNSDYKNETTRVATRHGGRTVTYVLTSWNGQSRIDDMEIPDPKHPLSVKMTMDVMLPVQEFLAALGSNQPKKLMAVSSADFNRTVWSQAEFVPAVEQTQQKALLTPLTSIQVDADGTGARIQFGTAYSGARFSMKKEHGRFAIDDVLVMTDLEPTNHVAMKSMMRNKLILREGGVAHRYANKDIGRTPGGRHPILPAGGSNQTPGTMRNAHYSSERDQGPHHNAIYRKPIGPPLTNFNPEADLIIGRVKTPLPAFPPLEVPVSGSSPRSHGHPLKKPHPLGDLRTPVVPRSTPRGNLTGFDL